MFYELNHLQVVQQKLNGVKLKLHWLNIDNSKTVTRNINAEIRVHTPPREMAKAKEAVAHCLSHHLKKERPKGQ